MTISITTRPRAYSWFGRYAIAATALAVLGLSFSAQAAMLLQEDFQYAPGILGTNQSWAGATSLITVTNTLLSFPNLSNDTPPSLCASVIQGTTAVSYRTLTTDATAGVVYCSFLIDFTLQPGSYYIAGLLQSTNAPPGGSADDPLDFIDEPYSAGFRFGIRAKGSTTSYMTNALLPLNTNTTYFVVLKYNFTNGEASLYFDPQPGAAEPASPDVFATGATVVPNLQYFYLRSGSSTAGNFLLGQVHVATTWSEATAGTVTSNIVTEEGTMLNGFLDSFQVTNYWIDGYSVNWLTGATNGNGPNMTIGTASHCSAFAPAVAELLGIYLLRPPQESDLDLANGQALWFPTNTDGWFPIDSMMDAQHMANSGTLVMASYYSTTGSGHICVLRASTRTDASIATFGPEECQSGESNYADTNAVTGFNQHPGAFPVNIYYYGHTVTYPITPVWPTLLQPTLSNGVFRATMTTIIGRPYQIQWGSNLVPETVLTSFTNSNIATNFFTNAVFSISASNAPRGFYSILPQ